jgi:hypothetical protein
LTSTLPIAVEEGRMIEPLSTPLASTHFAKASPPMAAAEASWPVWLMALRSRMLPSNELVVATGMPLFSAAFTMSL